MWRVGEDDCARLGFCVNGSGTPTHSAGNENSANVMFCTFRLHLVPGCPPISVPYSSPGPRLGFVLFAGEARLAGEARRRSTAASLITDYRSGLNLHAAFLNEVHQVELGVPSPLPSTEAWSEATTSTPSAHVWLGVLFCADGGRPHPPLATTRGRANPALLPGYRTTGRNQRRAITCLHRSSKDLSASTN